MWLGATGGDREAKILKRVFVWRSTPGRGLDGSDLDFLVSSFARLQQL